MGRLIDTDSLKDRASEYTLNEDEYRRFCEIIDAEPTAFDPDKVVEQLEEMSYERLENNGMGGELVVNLDDAIEIVRGDREPEPECEWKLDDAEGNLYATGCENRQLIF